MPPAKPKTKRTQDNSPLHNLHPTYVSENIRSAGGVEAASNRLASRSRSPEHLKSEIRALITAPDILSLLLAANSNICWDLESLSYNEFPRDSESYSTSFFVELLTGLNSFFCSLAPPECVDPSVHHDHGTSVPHVDRALRVIDTLNFEDQEDETLTLRPTKLSQRQTKQIRHRTVQLQKSQPDAVFDLLKVPVPRSEEESVQLVYNLLLLQSASLSYYLSTLTSPGIGSWIRSIVLRVVEAPSVVPSSRPRNGSVGVKSDVTPLHEEPKAEDLYPTVTPEKAKHFFDSPDGFGEWFLFISTTALKHLREMRRADQNMFGIVEKKIKELSNGFFSDSNQKRLGGGDDIPIFEAKMTSDTRLVYRIDLQVDPDLQLDRQVIRIHGVFTHAQFDHRFWSGVAQMLPKNDREYRRRCNYRVEPRVRGVGAENVTPPMIWAHQDYTMTPAPLPVHAFTEEEYLEFHKILSLEKFIPYSTAVLRAIMSDIETTHAFAVSPTETRIINHPSSCFVIGRSGTGKTTTMLFKLLGIEQAAHSSKYRQVFLTQSHVLAQRVQEYYEQLARAAELSHGTGHEDGHPGPVEQDLLHLDEEADDRSDLPKCFSNLADKHFPLFVTFDQVRRMLENDLNLSFSKHRTALRRQATRKMITEGGGISTLGINDHVNDDAEATASMVTVGRDNYVTFESFHRNYWPHIDQRLTKGLDPSLVYSEIMGVISGHEDTTKTEDGFLDRASYVSLSARAHSQFSTQRHRVYDIFEKYRKMKHGYGEYDSPDRTHAILRKLQQGISAKIDFLYVDEVQDLLTVDTKLLRELCANPRGLFWGGDTAQTISVGSSFRFEDLKALIWREERNDPLVKKGVREAVPSEVFELLVNYRSHGGIVDCAASLINLISSLFPYSIDKLQKECAVVSGPKPRIFRSDLVHFEEFLCDVGDTRMDFGARQVIIVRDDGAREELRRQLGDAGLILTLIESKGLEFDDVLLHDFFRSSPATATQWRVIATKSCDPIKHRVIESELKRLYVAVTRARHHCWIWDSSELAQPMINFWVTQNLVQVQDPSEDIPQLATQSTPEEWNTTGRYLFAKTLYVQAASCFAKANRDHDRRIAEAYQIRKEARVTNDILSFKEAGTAFSACASTAQGETAQGLYTRAAECFLQARETSLAADNYKAASEFTKAVQLYRKVGQFEDVASLLRPPDHSISLVDPGVADDMLDVVRMQFLRTDDIVRAGELFDTTDELLEYMDSWGFDAARKSVLKKLGNFASAAELHLRDGETLEAAECFTRSANPGDQQRAISCVLGGLWTQTFNNDFTDEASSLYKILEAMPPGSFSDAARAEASVFKAIAHRDLRDLVDLSRKYMSSNGLLATLCLNQVLRTPLHLQTSSLAGISTKLTLVDAYSQLILGLLRRSDMCSSGNAQKLLGFTPAVDPYSSEPLPDEYTVASKSSYLAALIQRGSRTEDEGIINGRELEFIVRSDLEDCVHRLLEDVHLALLRAPVLRPCLDTVLYNNCNRIQCGRDHTTVISMDVVNMRARIHMQAILTLVHLWAVRCPENKYDILRSVKRIWVERFYSSLYPVVHHIGNASESLVLSCPESKRAIPLIQAWIQERVFQLRPLYHYNKFDARFLADTLTLTTLASLLHQSLPQYFAGAFWLYERHPLLKRKDAEYSIVEDLFASFDCSAGARLFQGAFFIKHVVESNLPIDINVLVHFLEYLALAIIFNHRTNWPQPFHNLTMPRSWVSMALRGPRKPVHVRNLNFQLLLNPVRDLLRILYSRDGSDNFALDGHPLGSSYIPRAVIIARICRLLILIGENGPSGIRTMVLSAISWSLGTANSHHKMYSGYVYARVWSDARKVMRHSMFPPTEIDCMVFLQHKSQPIYIPTPSVRHVIFTDEADIKRALEYNAFQPMEGPTAAPQVPDTVAEAPLAVQDTNVTASEIPRIDKGVNEIGTVAEEAINEEWRPEDHATEDWPQEENTKEDWGPEDTIKEEFEVSGQPEEEGVLDLKKMEKPRTKEEHSAATFIQLWYRRCVDRKNSRLVKNLLVQQWAECAADVSEIKLVDDTVRLSYWVKMVRGPLPHVLCVVETLLLVVRKIKDTAKRRLPKAVHLELETIRDTQNITTKVYKELLAGRKMISPKHEIFRAGNLMGLRKGVREVERLLLECRSFAKPGDVDGLESHMKCGIKGIITEHTVKPTVKKEGKPTFCRDKLCRAACRCDSDMLEATPPLYKLSTECPTPWLATTTFRARPIVI